MPIFNHLSITVRRYNSLFCLFGAVVSGDGAGVAYSPASTTKQQQPQSNHNGGVLPAFTQRFSAHASAYTAAGGSSRSSAPYHSITTSGVAPYHLSAAVNNAAGGSSADASSLQWAASHGYQNTDGTINYVSMPNTQTSRGRSSTSAFSAAASLSARKYKARIFTTYFLFFFSPVIVFFKL